VNSLAELKDDLLRLRLPEHEGWFIPCVHAIHEALHGDPEGAWSAILTAHNCWRPKVFNYMYRVLFKRGQLNREQIKMAFLVVFQQDSEYLSAYLGGQQEIANLFRELLDAPGVDTPLEVWRGVAKRNHVHKAVIKGISWTTDISVACFFATCCQGAAAASKRSVVRTIVQPDAILGFLDGRSESEVLVDPSKIGAVYLEDFSRTQKRMNTKQVPVHSPDLYAKWRSVEQLPRREAMQS
jgi:hypothetical protein